MEKSEVKSFLANLDVILIRKNIKKGEFYEGVGVTSGAVSQWKTGSTTPSDRTVKKIADYLGVPVSALIEQKEKPTAQGDGLDVDYIEKWIDNDASEEQLKLFIARASAKLVEK